MKICIPTKKDNGLNSIVYGHFGSAPCFVVYDTTNKDIKAINNMNERHAHGQCNPLLSFKDNPIDIMITGGIGMRALQKLNVIGVKAFKTNTEQTVSDVIDSYNTNKLKELTLDDSCMHHNCQ
ncbi:NifB/NifX family molybdenum-iron cluster-binding protein [Spirochaetota bacterium]